MAHAHMVAMLARLLWLTLLFIDRRARVRSSRRRERSDEEALSSRRLGEVLSEKADDERESAANEDVCGLGIVASAVKRAGQRMPVVGR